MSATRPVIRIAGRSIAVDLPHLAFVTVIGAWSAWFCSDAWHSNAGVENLILIVPVSAAAVILYLFIAARCFSFADESAPAASPREPLARGIGFKVAVSMALLAAFVVTGPWIGFDVASFLYIFATMAFLGERRILVLLLVPLVFCVAAIYCFNDLLQTPLPLFFAPGNPS
jgi:putative tricarboxylic transport membrane protein